LWQVLSSLCVRLGVFGNIDEISAIGISEQVGPHSSTPYSTTHACHLAQWPDPWSAL
jgi:hypothetical protein